MIPFGRGNKKRQGIVMNLKNSETENTTNLKEIHSLLDKEPVLNDEMLKMAQFMKSHCFCTYYDAVKAMLPAGINYKITTEYTVQKPKGNSPDDNENIEDDSEAIFDALFGNINSETES